MQVRPKRPTYNAPTSSRLNRRSSSRFKKLKRFKKLFLIIIVLGIIISLIYLFASSSNFTLSEVVTEENSIENQLINEQVKGLLKDQIGANLAFVNTSELENKILEHFPSIESITINKDYPNKIKVNFTKYPLAANVITESNSLKKSYIINSIGLIAQEDLENTRLPYIKFYSDEPINPQLPLINTSTLEYILTATQTFEERFGIRVVEVEYKKVARELHLLTEKDFIIWLDIQQETDAQFKKLKKALVKLDIYKEPLQYIDLRIAGNSGDKIIYKRK